MTFDLPMLECEVATVRARALQRLGQRAVATRQAEHALNVASKHGMVERVRGIRLEFRVGATETTGQPTRTGRGGTAIAGPAGRRLAALQQVSVAAATVLDPVQLARVALDETIRIFAAERAILFLADPAGRLQPHLGRTATGVDIDELAGYGSTFVEQVRESREALVVTSGEHGAALGSKSVVAYGLRSVMVSPLQLKGDLLGALYLDSRVAKGVFTDDDVDILTAITNQIAASMVTAQAAQLEATLRAAERRSELADTMRTSMAEVNQTLDPDEVESRLLATLVRAIGADAGVVLHEDGSYVSTGETLPETLEPAVLKLLDLVEQPSIMDTADTGVATLYPGAGTCLALPLTSRARRVGLLLLASTAERGYDDGQLRVAAALAEQGMVAYDNALLYRQVEQLAGTDPLTGLHNRRQFFKLSTDLFDAARQTDQPLAAVMLDIDHFKRVNDTYGHAAGDDVIREVAARLRGVLRDSDLLGRYGGEEFALILPGRAAGAAADLGERLRQWVAAAPIQTRSGPLDVTISVGTTQLQPADRTLDDALARADAALYRAKQSGRNQVVAFA